MAFDLSIRAIAYVDIDEAVAWYNAELDGLGVKFLNSLSTTLNNIKTNPFAYSVVSEPVRRCLLKNFPYKVLFFIAGNEIVVIAVIHIRRSNRFVRRRIR